MIGISHHTADLGTNLVRPSQKVVELIVHEVFAGKCCSEPVLGLAILTVCIAQFGNKVRRVTPLLPSFGNVGSDRSRLTTNLIRESVPLFCGKLFGEFEDDLLQVEGKLVHVEFFK